MNPGSLAQTASLIRGLWPDDRFWRCDIGAAGAEKVDRWSPFQPVLHTLGFEPNPAEFAKLGARSSDRYVNAAVAGANGTGALNIARYWSNSSLLEPNSELLQKLEWGNDHEIVERAPIECVTLDAACAGQDVAIDFLKVDTQGTELAILKAATAQLRSSVVCVEVEVEFCELYRGQGLFPEVDVFLRSEGFYLHELGNLLSVKPRGKSGLGGPKGRLISADAVYFRQSGSAVLSSRHLRALLVA